MELIRSSAGDSLLLLVVNLTPPKVGRLFSTYIPIKKKQQQKTLLIWVLLMTFNIRHVWAMPLEINIPKINNYSKLNPPLPLFFASLKLGCFEVAVLSHTKSIRSQIRNALHFPSRRQHFINMSLNYTCHFVC